MQKFLSYPIHSEADYDATVARINVLIDKGDLTADEQDYLTLLGTLVMAYEDEHYPDEKFELRGLELLKPLMTESDLQEKDLMPIFKTSTAISAVLQGHKPFTSQHLQRLSTYFHLPQELFIKAVVDQTLAMA